ncbi:MAG: alpha/beta fold hydrolase [Oscillospiraceae bacterium]|nr:alpha/beta fold hydrolase [Oscillospiraceae bacterium]
MVVEKIVIGNEYPLDGLRTIPDKAENKCPAVVLVHGSGAHDMDEKIYGIRPFKDIAEGLAAVGIASVRYNKRSLTYGKKMMKTIGKSLTVREETIEDAVFAANLLRNDPRINPEKIYIIGHSMGGMLAPRIDAEGGNFAGLIILAGSPRKLEQIMKEQQANFMKTAKGPIKWIAGKQIKKYAEKLDKIYILSDDEAKKVAFAGGTSLYYLKEWGMKSSAQYLENFAKPILVMHGGKDLQVSTEEDFDGYKDILKDHPDATFKFYPDLNHAFMPALYNEVGKAMKEFKQERQVEDYVIADMAKWINAHA